MTTTDEDPLGVFAMSDPTAAAAARKLLRRAGVYTPTSQQLGRERVRGDRVRSSRTRRDQDGNDPMSVEVTTAPTRWLARASSKRRAGESPPRIVVEQEALAT
jgi:hypothetical protein